MSLKGEHARAMHVFGDGYVARLSQTGKGVHVRGGKVGLLEHLNESLPKG